MRYGTEDLMNVLRLGSFDFWYVIDVFYDGTRVVKDCPVTNVQISDDGGSLIQGTASLTVAYQGDFAESLAPSRIGDYLSPFGAQINLDVIVSAGPGFMERIPMGKYQITQTPKILSQGWILFDDTIISNGDLIDLDLQDLFFGVSRDRFDIPGTPPSLVSVWAEVQRLTGLPVTRTITDGAITAAVAYQQDKLQAVYDLATVLDATACMLPDGTVSMRPNAWPDPVDVLQSGDQGTLVSYAGVMINDEVYNKIVVRSSTGSQNVLASAEITDGPLRAANPDGSLSPYRRVPLFYSSQYITTAAQAQRYATTNLPRVSQMKAVKVTVTEIFNPLRMVGDVLTIHRMVDGRTKDTATARVTALNRTSAATQQTTLAVGNG
ncbi:hypothetical protein [Subtercola endophyticus]|uniref:hypothetical protein n=1 Tax=Subtercola endophyticus TaxID=2895559 RepID=UPI001E4BE93A|nr:hypothetical protein [Subtercola endophyticus]UFS59468.1 hypothetical protein LQ955_01315 [Subtercola endophyticus]